MNAQVYIYSLADPNTARCEELTFFKDKFSKNVNTRNLVHVLNSRERSIPHINLCLDLHYDMHLL